MDYPFNTECTNRFTSMSDGITFEFVNFETEVFHDSVVFQDARNEHYQFTGPFEKNKWNGARFSFNSSDVEVLFVSDANGEETGFNIKIIDGYEASNDIDALWPQFAADMPM
ncbi:Oidioi.mRNA.OKI2018_I69.PAR.g9753.t1.cds [Oikopleura dioica]|uniref:Oidioi.mRNA.OKI2018_I69.PAR.g9753.t1.cds n=1 Tax=Oikopleura dioica TaxID=34765 RepID=A0ABN7RM25_OIKDI|nr:Oidioi.mRNA.OKI2018_I69.PAR.g9753.t1.cds [Oikopleura dioica]